MGDDVLKTSADYLYELVKSKKKISIEDAAKQLKMTATTIQALVDFLVEEKIFGIEYKFTTPYIYISQEKTKKIADTSSPSKKIMTKEEFFKQANRWNIPIEKTNEMWNKYINENIARVKEEFYSKARLRNFPEEKLDNLWERYLGYLR